MKSQHATTLFLFLSIAFFLFISAGKNQQSFDKITVREFELVGEDGKRRANIRVEDSGEVVFRLMDKSGTIRVKLGASESGSGLVLLDKSTEPGFQALSKDKGGKLVVFDKNGKQREL